MRCTPTRTVLVLLCVMAWAGQAAAVGVGDKAPDFRLPGTSDEVVLSGQNGKLVYLDFWASWCGPCRQSFPWMNSLQSRFGPQGLRVIAINVDTSIDAAKKFLADVPAQFAVAFDSRGLTPRSYAIKGMPTSMLIAPDGQVLYVHVGFRPDERAVLESKIVQALGR